MTYLVYALVIFLAFLFQITGFSENLVFVTLFTIFLLAKRKEAAFLAFFAGLLLDLYSPFPYGLTSIIFLLFLLALTLLRKITALNWPAKVALAAVSFLIYRLFLTFPFFEKTSLFWGVGKDLFVSAVLFPPLRFLKSRLFAAKDLQLELKV